MDSVNNFKILNVKDSYRLKNGDFIFLDASKEELENMPDGFDYDLENMFINYICCSDIPFIKTDLRNIFYDESFKHIYKGYGHVNKSKDEILQMLKDSKKIHAQKIGDCYFIGFIDESKTFVAQLYFSKEMYLINTNGNFEKTEKIINTKQLDAFLNRAFSPVVLCNSTVSSNEVSYELDSFIDESIRYDDKYFIFEINNGNKINSNRYIGYNMQYFEDLKDNFVLRQREFKSKVNNLLSQKNIDANIIKNNLKIDFELAQTYFEDLIKLECIVKRKKGSSGVFLEFNKLKLRETINYLFGMAFSNKLKISKNYKYCSLFKDNKKENFLENFYSFNVVSIEKDLENYLNIEQKQRLSELKNNLHQDYFGEIFYEISSIYKSAAVNEIKKNHPDEPLCQWDFVIKDKAYLYWLNLAMRSGHIEAIYFWFNKFKRRENWNLTRKIFEELVLEYNYSEAAESIADAYAGHYMFNHPKIVHKKNIVKTSYWNNVAKKIEEENTLVANRISLLSNK